MVLCSNKYSSEVKDMSRSKIAVAAATAFFGIALSASAGIVYPSEATTNWFTVVAADANLSASEWTVPTDGAEVVGNAIQIDTDVTEPLKYQPASASGPVAVVNANISVLPNASLPAVGDLGDAQAAITVVTNTTTGGLEWHGLANVSGSAAWVQLQGNTPVSGAEYGIQIVVDNHNATKRIRYAVTPDGGAAVVLTDTNGDAWLGNPRNTNAVSAVAFAGSGTVGNFSGDNLKDDGAEIALEPEVAGYDFTNGVVKAVVTLPDNPSGSDRTAVLKVVNFANGTTTTYDAQTVTSSGQEVSWDLSNLTPGGTYSYTVEVTSGNSSSVVKSGTFTAANWTTNCWFGVGDSSAEAVTNGVFSGATFADSKWGVDTNAEFKVTDIAPGSNAVSRVDTRYSFESFIDAESLERLGSDAVGGIVAVGDGGGAWYAYTGVNDPDNTGWEALDGGVTPVTNVEYIVRAEFDFMSQTHRVRYLVSSDDGASFVPLALAQNDSEWINLVSQEAGSLSSVEMAGKGYVKTISAKVADRAVAESDGVKYNTLWEALRNGNGTVTLLTSATLKPSDIPSGSYGPYTINIGGYNYVVDLSDLSGNWRFIQKGEQWYLIKSGTVYIFF